MGKRLPWSLVCGVFVFVMLIILMPAHMGWATNYLAGALVNVDRPPLLISMSTFANAHFKLWVVYLGNCFLPSWLRAFKDSSWSFIVALLHLPSSWNAADFCILRSQRSRRPCLSFILPLRSGLAPTFIRNVPILNFFITFQSCDFFLAVIISVVAAHWILTW